MKDTINALHCVVEASFHQQISFDKLKPLLGAIKLPEKTNLSDIPCEMKEENVIYISMEKLLRPCVAHIYTWVSHGCTHGVSLL